MLSASASGRGAVLDAARSAAALWTMTDAHDRVRQRVGVTAYAQMAPRLRMSRMAHTAGCKVDFELCSHAVSAVDDRELRVQVHERAVLHGGLGGTHVHEVVRIAAVVAAAASVRTASRTRSLTATEASP